MTVLGPELRRALADAVLRGGLGRDPTSVEVAVALRGSTGTEDLLDVVRHVATDLGGRLARAASAVAAAEERLRQARLEGDALRQDMSSLRSSASWRLMQPVRAFLNTIPAGARTAVRKHIGRLNLLMRGRHDVPEKDPATREMGAMAIAAKYAGATAAWAAGDIVVSIIVVNCNTGAQTAACVRQVLAQTRDIPYEIIVVDNGSSEDDLSCLHPFADAIRLVRIGSNRFRGEASNIAAEAAAGEFLCFLGNDIEVDAGWLSALLGPLREDPSVGASGPEIRWPDGDLMAPGGLIRETDVANVKWPPAKNALDVDRKYDVEFLPGAAILVRATSFFAAGGFDLAFEPAYFEDFDLCMKLRLRGQSVCYCPSARVRCVVALTPRDAGDGESQTTLLDLSRGKFFARWAVWPGDALAGAADALRRDMIPADRGHVKASQPLPRATVFTPFLLTPGGGERAILTLASVLSETHNVEIATVHQYSRLRLVRIGHEFSIDLSRCSLTTYQSCIRQPKADLWVTLGNHLFPPVAGFGDRCWYVCQFPFPMDEATATSARVNLSGYDLVLAYSQYTLSFIKAGLMSVGEASIETNVLYPPVSPLPGSPASKRRMVLSVGRFISGGHTKRHDALIDAFRTLSSRVDGGVELHLAGSSFPMPEDMDYLTGLKAAAADLPVTFHVNATGHTLRALYRDAMFYWHATGYGLVPSQAPERMEHFGITVVEAMSAGCVPLAFDAGGPSEIIKDGVTGFLFESLDALVAKTAALMDDAAIEEREKIGRAAANAVQTYSADRFKTRVEHLVRQDLDDIAVLDSVAKFDH